MVAKQQPAATALLSWMLAVQNIAEWEMTDADIEVAIKLADKSGDGRIDYDEFIAFVFGEDEPVRRVQQTGTNSVLPEHNASQIQAGPSLTPADMRQSAAQAWHLPADPLQLQRDAFQVPPDTFQVPAPAFHMPAVAFEPTSGEWHGSHQQPEAEVPSTRHASQPQLAFSQHAEASDVSMRPQSMTDIWVASQTEAMAASAEQQSVLQPGMVYDNALYQAEASGTSQSAAGRGHREAAQQSDCPQAVLDQTGDDMRLRVQSDDTEHDHSQQPGSQFCSQDNGYHGPPGQARHQMSTHAGYEPEGAEAAGNSHHDSQLAEDVRLLYVARDPQDVERLSSSNVDFAQAREDSSEPGGLQATWHDGALHLSLPLEELHTADTSPTGSNASANDESQHSRRQQHTGRPAALTKVPSKPRKLPPLSHDQLSRGINRSLVSHQDSNRPQ